MSRIEGQAAKAPHEARRQRCLPGQRAQDRRVSQAEYARLSALVRLRLEALQRALDDHEEARRWEEHGFLEHVEAGLAELRREVPRS